MSPDDATATPESTASPEGSAPPEGTAPRSPVERLAVGLAAVLGSDPDPVSIHDLRRLSGGASRETWRFRAVSAGSARDLVMQRTRPGGAATSSMAAEDDLLLAAEAAGVPVPATVVAARDSGPLAPARITEAVAGEALGPRLVRAERTDEARVALAGQLGRALAAIHSIPPDEHPGLGRRDVLTQARMGLDALGEARPAFELALRWLADERPAASAETVVHGDFRVGNLLIDGDELTGVLDWELAHRGDPLEDLGWLCVRAWRFGAAPEVGGLTDLEPLLAAYSEARGASVEPAAVRWWIAAGTLTWGMICAVQARRHLDGHVRSVELATVGRRVCENEHDLLDLMGVPPHSSTDSAAPGDPNAPGDSNALGVKDGSARGSTDLHGRPTAAELLAAVRDHLADEVAPHLTGGTAFSMKVVDRALATVQREVEGAEADRAEHLERLKAWGVDSETELAAAIRAGDVSLAEVGPSVRSAVAARLRVANPRWAVDPPAVFGT